MGRKLGAHFGWYLRRFFHPVSKFLEAESGNEALADYIAPTAKAFERLQRATGEDKAFYEAKLRTGRFYMQRMLPRSGALFATLMAGAKPMMDFPDEAF